MDPESSEAGQIAGADPPRGGVGAWLEDTNRNPGLVAFIRRARRALPGDPDFGDPLSAAGEGGPRAAARAADRLLTDREAASREVSLAGLQVWQALTERLARRPGAASPGNRRVPSLAPGDKVTHDAYGLGTVLSLQGSGDDPEAKIDFGGEYGVKHLVLRYAPIEKL